MYMCMYVCMSQFILKHLFTQTLLRTQLQRDRGTKKQRERFLSGRRIARGTNTAKGSEVISTE